MFSFSFFPLQGSTWALKTRNNFNPDYPNACHSFCYLPIFHYFGYITGSKDIHLCLGQNAKRRICTSPARYPPFTVVLSMPISLNLKIPMTRESQGKQAGPFGPTFSCSSGKFSNAKLGRFGLYFYKEKQNPNTYDSLLSP